MIGDSTLRGTKSLIWQPDLTHREFCCLPGARVRDFTRKLTHPVRPCDYYPLLVFQVGNEEIS